KLTKPLALADKALPTELLRLSSWVYRDAPDYGSATMDERQESVDSLTLSDDKTSLFVKLASVKHPLVHPQQTARVYHFALDAQALFDLPSPRLMDAYYTLYRFPAPWCSIALSSHYSCRWWEFFYHYYFAFPKYLIYVDGFYSVTLIRCYGIQARFCSL